MSYNGEIDFGLLGDYDAMPDLDDVRPTARGRRSPSSWRRRARPARPARAEREQEGRNSRHGEKEDTGVLMRRTTRRSSGPRGRGSPRARRPRGAAQPVRPRLRAPERRDVLPDRARRRARPELRRRPARRGRDAAADRRRPIPDDRDDARLRRQQDARSRPRRPGGPGYNNVFYAQQGYAVVNYRRADSAARAARRTRARARAATPAGSISPTIATRRRDTQHLLGLLVDQGVARPDALGVTGVSYGGIQSLNLARLRNRIRLPDGSFRAGRARTGRRSRSPRPTHAGPARTSPTRCSRTAASSTSAPEAEQSITPGGVMKKSYNDGLYFSGNATGFYAPTGGAFSSDITPGRRSPTAASPPAPTPSPWAGSSPGSTAGRASRARARRCSCRTAGPTTSSQPPEALRVYRTFHGARGARISLQLADLGHPRGTNDPGQNSAMERQAVRLLRRVPEASGQGARPRQRARLHPDLPAHRAGAAAASGPRTGSACTRRPRPMRHRGPLRMNSRGGNPATAQAIDPIGGGGERAGRPGRARTGHGRDPAPLREAVHDARAADRPGADRDQGPWRLHRRAALGRASRQAVLVSRGVYRLRDNQRGNLASSCSGTAGASRAGTPRSSSCSATTRTSCARATSSSGSRSRVRG